MGFLTALEGIVLADLADQPALDEEIRAGQPWFRHE